MNNNIANIVVAGWIGLSLGIAHIHVTETPILFFIVLVPVIIINSIRKEN